MKANTSGGGRLNRLLRFTDGLIVDPADCPLNIAARSHWTAGPDGKAVCPCDPAGARAEADARSKEIESIRAARLDRRRRPLARTSSTSERPPK